MAFADDLEDEVKGIFAKAWTTREGQKVPETEDLGLGNDGVKLNAVVLYADLADSTDLVNDYAPEFAAEIYKTFLHCASKIIKDQGGVITAFDGDRVMGVFIGNLKDSLAAIAALEINYAVLHIINPALKNQYPNSPYVVRHSVGIDRSDLLVTRTGVRGSNDLVWVGRAANYAAKLCAERSHPYASFITSDVYDALLPGAKTGDEGKSMWERYWWSARKMYIYRSSWWYRP